MIRIVIVDDQDIIREGLKMNQNAVSRRVLVETVIIMLITFSSVFVSSATLNTCLKRRHLFT